MSKKSRTEKETNRLLNILGESVLRRYINFFIGLGVLVGAIYIFFIFFSETTMKTDERIRFCEGRTDTYIKEFYSGSPKAVKLKEGYDSCKKEFKTTFVIDSSVYCEGILKKRYIKAGVGSSKRAKDSLDKIIKNCGIFNIPHFEDIKTEITAKIDHYNRKIEERRKRKELGGNKALRIELERWIVAKKDYEDRLTSLGKVEKALETK